MSFGGDMLPVNIMVEVQFPIVATMLLLHLHVVDLVAANRPFFIAPFVGKNKR